VSDDLTTKIKNTTQQSADNSSEGLTMNFMIVIIIIFLLIVGTPVVFGGYIGKKVFLYIGPILLIAALALVAVFFITTQKEQTQYNSPFSACVGTKTLQKDFIRCKYGDLKTRVEDDDIIGYDFFIDIPDGGYPTKIEPSKIKDTQLGSAVYITVAPDAGAACSKEDPVSSASVSYIKKRQKYIFLVIAGFLFVAGMGILIYGLLKPTPKKLGEKHGHRKNEIEMVERRTNIGLSPPGQPNAEDAKYGDTRKKEDKTKQDKLPPVTH
jgi:energy-coupling factor transporter transmembrane protein EcfT